MSVQVCRPKLNADQTALAIRNGVAFISGQQGADGEFQDFNLPVGSAHAWVTALVGRLLLISNQANARCAAEKAADHLEKICANGRWSYNGHIEHDCDSTAWAALLFHALERNNAEVDLDFIRAHQSSEGGFCTYCADDAWGQPHTCVTPIAMLALEQESGFDQEAVRWLLSQRSEKALWFGYWWVSAFYPTLMAHTVIERSSVPIAFDCNSLLQVPELTQIRSALDLSCAVLLACMDQSNCDVRFALASALCDLQLPDGSWPMSICLRVVPHWIYPKDVGRIPRQSGQAYADVNQLVTTGFAVAALSVTQGESEWL